MRTRNESEAMNGIKEKTEVNAIINRHIARIMTDLEDAGCATIFRDAVKGKLQWMRSDVNAVFGTNGDQKNVGQTRLD